MNLTNLESASVAYRMRFTSDRQDEAYLEAVLNGVEAATDNPNRLTGLLGTIPESAATEIGARVELLEAFPTFEQAVDTLLAEIEACGAPANHPYFLDSGSSADVFGLYVGDKLYAVRRSRFVKNQSKAAFIEDYVPALIRGRGYDAFEQIVTYNYERGVTISEMLPAVSLQSMADPSIVWLHADMVTTMFDDLDEMVRRGIEPDNVHDNILVGVKCLKFADYRLGHQSAAEMAQSSLRRLFRVFSNQFHKNVGRVCEGQLEELRQIVGTFEARYTDQSSRVFAKVLNRAVAEIPNAPWIDGFS